MFAVSEIKCSIGARLLFEDVSFTLNPGQRAGLVGPNGAGKTTLLKIIAGQIEPDAGRIIRPSNAVVGYLPQELSAEEFNGTVWDEAFRAFEHVQEKARELDAVHEELSTVSDEDEPRFHSLLQRQHELSAFLEHSGYHQQESHTARVLAGLGFSESDFHRPLSQFSGGWKMRASLARLLLASPDVLLLDEPTNHLDMDSVTWLEEWLLNQAGALLLVSHDEHFLNRLSQRIISLESGTAVVYQGNYQDYLVQSEERRRLIEAEEKSRQARIKETERFIERFRAKATKARQVQSRIKMLEREKREAEQEHGLGRSGSVHFTFPEPERSGRDVVIASGISKSYLSTDDECGQSRSITVFSNLDFRIERGDHIAVVGPNGSGKSTLARIIAGGVEPDEGTLQWGHNVSVSYFGQHQAAELPQDVTVLEAMGQVPGGEAVQRVRDLLGAFLFHADMVNSKVRHLSGGEKSRLALARMLLNPANLLVLDEPTNHLDITSKEVVKNALKGFSGSFVLVSHDRAFMQDIISKVWEMRRGVLTEYLGGIEDYLSRLTEGRNDPSGGIGQASSEDDAEVEGCSQSERRISAKELRRQAARKREELRKKLGPLQSRVKEAEEKLVRLEEEKEEVESLLADPSVHSDGARMKELNSLYKNLMQRIDEMYLLWDAAEEELQAAMKNL